MRNRGYSQRLQRVVVDFGAEHSFGKAAERVREHYGIDVSIEAIRQHILRCGRNISQLADESNAPPKTLIVQMDGTMIPVGAIRGWCGSAQRQTTTVARGPTVLGSSEQ